MANLESSTSPVTSPRVCLVTGVGPGTGKAIVERFVAGGYAVAMLARNEDRLQSIAANLPGAHAFRCDVTETDALKSCVDCVRNTLGRPSVVIHNAVGGAFGSFQEIDPEKLAYNFQVNTMATEVYPDGHASKKSIAFKDIVSPTTRRPVV